MSKGKENPGEYKLDFKAMFEQMSQKTQNLIALQNEYFKLHQVIGENSEVSAVVGKNLMKMSLPDQIAVLRIAAQHGVICAELNRKYKFVDSDEIEEVK